MRKTIVLGAGISGLSAAWQIGLLKEYEVAVYEKKECIGGLCGFYNFNGLKLDYGPHKIYSVLPGIMETFKEVGGDKLNEKKKKQKIVVRQKFLDYPIRFGQVLSIFTFAEIIEASLSVLKTLITPYSPSKVISYEDYCIHIFGKKIYDMVFRPLAEKTWGNPKTLSAEIARRRIPTKNIYDLLSRLLKIKKESRFTDAETILYPYEGFYEICNCIAGRIEDLGFTVYVGRKPIGFDIQDNKVKAVIFDDSTKQECDLIVSSIALQELIMLLFPHDKSIAEQANSFRMRHSIIAYLLIDRPKVIEDHWIFCADKSLIFSRISEQKLLSDFCFPRDKTIICCDFTSGEEDTIWKMADKSIIELCVAGLEELKLIKKEEVMDSRVVKIPNFYPCHDLDFEEKRNFLIDKINHIENVICIGRLGLADYCNTDHCLDMAIFIARALNSGEKPPVINYGLIERAECYRIVD